MSSYLCSLLLRVFHFFANKMQVFIATHSWNTLFMLLLIIIKSFTTSLSNTHTHTAARSKSHKTVIVRHSHSFGLSATPRVNKTFFFANVSHSLSLSWPFIPEVVHSGPANKLPPSSSVIFILFISSSNVSSLSSC